MRPEYATAGLWLAWLLSWTLAMLWTNRTEKRDAIAPELLFRFFFYGGLILLFTSAPRPQINSVLNWILVAPTAAGLAFTWWARIHLGRLWSDNVVKRTGHHVIDTGPYKLVRHPIYTGLIFAALSTAIQKQTAIALLSVITIALAFFFKARREERFLRAQLGQESYDAYARKTPMLAPFLPTSQPQSKL